MLLSEGYPAGKLYFQGRLAWIKRLSGSGVPHVGHDCRKATRKRRRRFKALRDSTLKTVRSRAIKALAMLLWHCASKT